jgi:hypothetical protein
MSTMTMSRNRWIEIQQKIITSAEGQDWYRDGRLPRILRNIGDADLFDLEFETDQDKMWFVVKWL